MPKSESDNRALSSWLTIRVRATQIWNRRHWSASHLYGVAILLTVATTVIYLRLATFAPNQAAPIVFLIPITLSAYWGGLGPGLVSTALGFLAAWYLFTPVPFSLEIAYRIDYVRLASLLSVGVLVSVVCESLRRAQERVAADSESGQQFAFLSENMGEGFAHCKLLSDAPGRASDFVYLNVNPAFERLTGVKNPAGKKATELFPQIREVSPQLLETYGRVVSTRRPEKFEIEFPPLKRWFAISVYSPREQEFIAVFDDITERKKAEEAKQEDGAELAAIYSNVPQLILLLDSSLRVCKANKLVPEGANLAGAEVVGNPVCLAIRCVNAVKTPEDCGRGPQCENCSLRLAVLDTFATGKTRRSAEAVLPLTTTDGHRDVALLVSTARLEVKGQPRVLVVAEDISDRKEAEKRLHTQFAMLKSITDKSSDSIFVTDSKGRATFLNPEAEKVFGFSLAELKGKSLHDAIHHHHADRRPYPASECPVMQTFTSGAPLRNFEDVYFRKDGTLVDVLGSIAVLDVDGQRLGIVCVLHDVTERKREARVKQRSQKLEALGTIAGGIAHDFNNILGSINGNAHYAISDLGASGPVRDCLVQISKAGDRAAGLVRRILNFSAPREQTPVVQLLQPIADEAIKLIRATISTTIEIRSDFAPDLPPVNVDSSQMHQVIVNLLTNAAHAIGGRPGQIDIRMDAVDVGLQGVSASSNLRAGRYVRLYIADDGCGIDPVILDRIFDPFFTTKPIGQGTGLGLSIVHGIVTNLSGTITVDSKVGKGTAIHVYLPAAERRAQNQPPQEEKTPCQHRERVLYVDDEEDLVFIATNRLQRLGCTVTGFTDPEKALREFQLAPAAFDVVVTDVAMPRMSGFELARRLRVMRPDVPIVMTTGYVRYEDREAAAELGIREIVPKPCRIEDLTAAFERLSLATSTAASGQ